MATQAIRTHGIGGISTREVQEAIASLSGSCSSPKAEASSDDVLQVEALIWEKLEISPSEDLGRAFSRIPLALSALIREHAEFTVALKRARLQ